MKIQRSKSDFLNSTCILSYKKGKKFKRTTWYKILFAEKKNERVNNYISITES